MKRWLLLLSLCWMPLAWAGVPQNVPPTDDALLGQFLQSLYDHLNTLECLTANPNGSVLGTHGELKCANFGGTDYACMNTSTGPAKGTSWACLSASGNACTATDTQINFTSGTSCTGEAALTWNYTNDVLTITPAISTGTLVEFPSFISTGRVIGVASGTAISSERINQFLAPTINGVAGGAAETVTDAATVFINDAPVGSNITLSTAADLMFGNSVATHGFAWIKVQNQTLANTAGRDLELTAGNGLGSGTGGDISLESANGGGAGAGGAAYLLAGTGGSTSGNGGNAFVQSGNAGASGTGGDLHLQSGNGAGTNKRGGHIYINPGQGVGNTGNTIFIEPIAPSGSGMTTEQIGVKFRTFNPVVADGLTFTNERAWVFEAPTIDGVVGGGIETVTNAATLYVNAAPSGSNITFTNGPYAIWSDSGINRLDGNVEEGGVVTKYNGITTVSSGVPSELATVDSTGLTASVGASTLYVVPSTGEGLYRVSAYVVETTAASLTSTLPNVQVVYTDKDSNTSVTLDITPILGAAGIGQTGALTANTVGTVGAGEVPIYVKASTTIQYQTINYASNAAGMTYALHMKLEAL